MDRAMHPSCSSCSRTTRLAIACQSHTLVIDSFTFVSLDCSPAAHLLVDLCSLALGSAGVDSRQFKVTFDGVTMDATLVDLPTIIESQKTLDSINFYKTSDICQVGSK